MELPEVERATAYTPQPGDVVVLQMRHEVKSMEEVLRVKEAAESLFGVKVCVLGAGVSFEGVVHPEAVAS